VVTPVYLDQFPEQGKPEPKKPESNQDELRQTTPNVPSRPTSLGRLRLEETGNTFDLKEGRNVLGRIADTGTADIRISTDEYMSRRHIAIDAVKLPTGGYEHLLIEIGSLNPTLLNGEQIGRGDILVLSQGDKLTLGKTIVIFEHS
jgi:pSer/pThr/pTyr-binding forkhead associated (FHA) protein